MPAQTAPGSTVPPGSATRGSASLTGALILLATVQLMVVLDMTIVNVALPSIDRALRFTPGNISWRWVFLVNVPVAATVALLALRKIPAPARERGHIDVAGAITATASLGALIFGLSRAAEHGWGNGLTAGPIAAGLLGLATFVAVER